MGNPLVYRYRQIAQAFTRQVVQSLGKDVLSVALYGSVARGDVHRDSDIDLLIVLDVRPEQKPQYEERIAELYLDFEEGPEMSALRRRGYPVNIEYLVLSRAEADQTRPFYLAMTTEASILFDRDLFFAAKLDRVRQRMRELGTRRVELPEGFWIWQLTADPRPGEGISL